jgi:hypothetical protein
VPPPSPFLSPSELGKKRGRVRERERERERTNG